MGRTERLGFAFSGGGTRGACQVGVLRALHEAGIAASVVAGTSAGAVNAAWYALHPERPEGLEDIWMSLNRADVFPGGPLAMIANFVRHRYLHRSRDWVNFLRRQVGAARFEDCVIPCAVVATRLRDGARVVFDSGELVPAVAASTAIPGVFPPYEVDGELYVDGGVVEYMPLPTLWEWGATSAYAFDCTYLGPPGSRMRTLVGRAGLVASAEQVRQATAHAIAEGRTVHLLQPPIAPTRDLRDFRQSKEAIRVGYRHTREYLESQGLSVPQRGEAV